MKNAVVRQEGSQDGVVRALVLDGLPANVIGMSTCEALVAGIRAAEADERTRLLVVRGAGSDFSFGASIEEHLPQHARQLLAAFHATIVALAASPLPTLAAVRGRCLGGGLELALACGLVFAEEDAVFGAPEIRLGVFAPVATALLEGRLPRAVQEDLLLTGRAFGAKEAEHRGLVNQVVKPGALDEAIAAFVDESLRPRSLLGLRTATQAIRARPARLLRRRLAALERLYAEQLLSSDAGSEGIRAFLEKREPRW